MAILLVLIGYLLFGTISLVILFLGGILFISAGPRVMPKLVLRMYKAKPIEVKKDSQLFKIIEQLSKRAGLPNVLQLYYISSQMINAFATGTRNNALIAVIDGIMHEQIGREITALMQLGLSRAREYDAEVGAVDLIRDPHSLSTALQKIEKLHVRLLQRVMMPGRKLPEPSLLRTHPHNHERIERLEQMTKELRQESGINFNDSRQAGFLPDEETNQPRWHLNGLWH